MLKKRIICAALTAMLALGSMPLTGLTVMAASSGTTLTFSDSSIAETVSGAGYTINGTTLTIAAAGVYRIKGNCTQGSIVVSKSLDNVILVFDGLNLTSATTAPVVVKKGSNVTIHLDGTSTLTDNEDASTEETNEDFEGAAIKVKSGSTVTFCGEGTLNINGNAKNGIKGAAESDQIYNGGKFNISAVNNGIAADNSITINGGDFTINSDNDGIKSVPDADDTVSTGSVTINGGTFNINADGDGIQAEDELKITNGSFTIKTLGGYNDSSFDSDTMSCKGLKASGDREDIENDLIITGGSFDLNTADDAIHSDENAQITGGTFNIYTGEDGVHADTQLDLGISGGLSRDPEINIFSSYEGLESGTVNMYSGKYWIVASDDGINSAGGSSNGTDPGMGGGNTFNPGGRPGGQGGSGMPGSQGGTQTAGNYSLNISGGAVYVNALGDGLDSNGALNMTGGNITEFSQATGGDNSPLDCDGTMTLSGATVFAAGTNPMNENPSTSTSQSYYKQTSSLSAGTVVNVKNGNTVIYSDKLLRNINYLLYSEPNVSSSSVSVSTGGSVDSCKSNAFAHNWNNGTVETAATASSDGRMVYTCQNCSATEYKTIPAAVSLNCSGHDDTVIEEDQGFNVTFDVGSGASVDLYDTQDYSAVSAANATACVSRNSSTGLPDSTGEGQVNFSVKLESGYEIDSVTVSGGYKNLKDVSTDEYPNTYRVTKVTSDLTITVTTKTAASSLSNESSINSDKLTVGSKLTFTGAASGGTAPYTYTYQYKRTTASKWTILGATETEATSVYMTPTSVGTFDMKVTVRDSSGSEADKSFTLTVTDGKSTAFVNTSAISSSGISPGTRFYMYGNAEGSSGYRYAYYYKRTTARSWTVIGDEFGTQTELYFTPRTSGEFNIKIDIMDENGEIVSKQFAMTVDEKYAVSSLVNNSTISATSAAPGTQIVMTGAASGGTAPYTYAFYYKRAAANNWTVIGTEYSTVDTGKITLRNVGDYIMKVDVMDSDGNVSSKGFTVEISE